MAIIQCSCQCGCKRCKVIPPLRNMHQQKGLCEWCKKGEHISARRQTLVRSIVSVHLRKRLIIGMAKIVSR